MASIDGVEVHSFHELFTVVFTCISYLQQSTHVQLGLVDTHAVDASVAIHRW